MNSIFFGISLFFGLILVASPLVFAQTSDFNSGYTTGVQQGGIDKHANIFHVGSICLGQSNDWCNGFLSGYLDGFFSTLPLSTHTTTIIHERERGGCHGENCTKTTPTPPKPTPLPIPTPPPTPPKGNGSK